MKSASCTLTKWLSSAIERGAGGAVRFVADDEVEVGEPVRLLRFADNVNGLDRCRRRRSGARWGRGVWPTSRRGARRWWWRVAQLVHEVCTRSSSLSLSSCQRRYRSRQRSCAAGAFRSPASIRSTPATAVRGWGRGRARGPATGQRFGNLQAGEGFAGAAGHDELAAVGHREAVSTASCAVRWCGRRTLRLQGSACAAGW